MTSRFQPCSDIVVGLVARCTFLDVMWCPGDELTFENSDFVVVVTELAAGAALMGVIHTC